MKMHQESGMCTHSGGQPADVRQKTVAALRPGDMIGIISPAGPLERGDLEAGMAHLRAEGFQIREGRALFARKGYLAGSDAARLEDLHAMFKDRDIKAVFCSRGGYGSLRLLEKIDWPLLAANPKICMGFSDLTALLLAIWRKARFITFHGPVVRQMGELDRQDMAETLAVLRGAPPRPIRLPREGVLRPGRAKGPLIGGNLTLLSHLAGTPYFPDLSGAVLFLEDHGEQPYRVDRMLRHLALSGALRGVSGLIGGDFIQCGTLRTIAALFLELADELDVPCTMGLPSGHGERNVLLPIGAEVELDTLAGILEIMEAPADTVKNSLGSCDEKRP
ncbi:LD-carboxypeptidase [uncultured Desulfatiglans sp.]|uniref:LD-carboxypeptidase n=1 Tax=Uncultured Desulfatiglans sp. TaxID=1748965 RepID=A0A653AHU2_UNCDX|nr:LD-carboxypeptidase [uncultured Desulfatiglans sp.]